MNTEPYQQAVVWPTYSQTQTTLPSAQHLLMPPLTAHQIQPPPLAPLLLGSSDYLASATMHQHTQSTRLVALASDNKRCKGSPTVPMPIQTGPTLIKIEDCSPVSHTSGPPSFTDHLMDLKSLPTAAIQSTMHTHGELSSDMSSPISFYPTHGMHGSLIQIAPQSSSMNTLAHNTSSSTTASILGSMSQPTNHMFSPPPNVVVSSVSCLTPPSEPFSKSDLDSSGISSIPDGKLIECDNLLILLKDVF